METQELSHFLALSLAGGIGARRLLAMVDYFGSAERAYHAPEWELKKVPGLGEGVAQSVATSKTDALAEATRQLGKLGTTRKLIVYSDEEYPESLRTIYSPPALLFVDGDPTLLREEKMVAIVGSRRTTDYGKRIAKQFAEDLVKENVVIVSGFAKGIDTTAHAAAFEANGKTIAVLGSGIDVLYPSGNKMLAQHLIESGQGIIVSELPLGSKPDPRNFPWRNRIVSGLSKAVVIVESEVKGGSMITASIALDQNREVFAVPGDIERPMSTGPNRLIRESQAKLVVSAEQILEELGWSAKAAAKQARPKIDRTALSLFESKIVDELEEAGEPIQIDNLAERAGLQVQEIMVQLLGLEFKGVVRQMAGKMFTLVR